MTEPSSTLIAHLEAWKQRDQELGGQVAKHRGELLGLVEAARDRGVPLARVAGVLGVSRQALDQRLGRMAARSQDR